MKEVPSYEAGNGLPALIARVEKIGESVLVTRHEKLAGCVPAAATEDRRAARTVVARMLIERLDREGSKTEGPSWEQLKSEMDAERP